MHVCIDDSLEPSERVLTPIRSYSFRPNVLALQTESGHVDKQ